MDSTKEQYEILIKALLPEEIFDYFEIVKVNIEEKRIDVYIDELNILPSAYSKEKLYSKGFHEPVIIQDFPIRKRAVYLHIRRRKWQIQNTREVISREWDLSAKGTRYTKDFATFLKGLFGQLPDQQ